MSRKRLDRKYAAFFGDDIIYPIDVEENISGIHQRARYKAAEIIKEKYKDILDPRVSISDIADYVYGTSVSARTEFNTPDLINLLNKIAGTKQ